jgi:membrane protein
LRPSLRKAWTKYLEYEIALVSAALAFHTLLAVVPVIGLGFWYLQRLGITKKWIVMTRQYVLDHVNVSSSSIFLKHFDELSLKVQGIGWGWGGFLVLLYTSVSLLAKFGRGLDSVMNVPSELKGDWVQKSKIWLRRACGLMGLPLALTISVVVSQWIKEDSWFNQLFEIKHLGSVLLVPLSWATTVTSVFFVYYFIPSQRVGLGAALRLALLVGPILELLRILVGVYARSAFAGLKIYGVFAAIPVFILWIQLSWAVLLLGAVLLRVLDSGKGGKNDL